MPRICNELLVCSVDAASSVFFFYIHCEFVCRIRKLCSALFVSHVNLCNADQYIVTMTGVYCLYGLYCLVVQFTYILYTRNQIICLQSTGIWNTVVHKAYDHSNNMLGLRAGSWVVENDGLGGNMRVYVPKQPLAIRLWQLSFFFCQNLNGLEIWNTSLG